MQNITSFLLKVAQVILNPIIQVLFAVALVYFLWGVFEYIRQPDSSDAKSKGVQHIFWGLIGLAIMVSVFGIINIALNTFNVNLDSGGTPGASKLLKGK